MCHSPILFDEIDASDNEVNDSVEAGDDCFVVDIEDPNTLGNESFSSQA